MNNRRLMSNAAFLITFFISIFLTGCSATSSENQALPSITLSGTAEDKNVPSINSTTQNDKSNSENEGGESREESSGEFDNDDDEISDGFAELEIEDQTGDGTAVSIEEARQSLGNALLVVFDSTGKVLGTGFVRINAQPVSIGLEPPLLETQKLMAQLFLDNGNRSYDPGTDTPILDHDGDLVRETFDYILSNG